MHPAYDLLVPCCTRHGLPTARVPVRIACWNLDSEEHVQVSLWNFVKYNVVGGGESALYGVEPWYFYLVNGLLNFNLTLLLALCYPLLLLLHAAQIYSVPLSGCVVTAIAPLFVWLAAISALPHKEERFLYVTYPQVCSSSA